jgi:hypothetical protein
MGYGVCKVIMLHNKSGVAVRNLLVRPAISYKISLNDLSYAPGAVKAQVLIFPGPGLWLMRNECV